MCLVSMFYLCKICLMHANILQNMAKRKRLLMNNEKKDCYEAMFYRFMRCNIVRIYSKPKFAAAYMKLFHGLQRFLFILLNCFCFFFQYTWDHMICVR